MAENNDLLRERLSILGKIGALKKEINEFNKSNSKDLQKENELNKKAVEFGKQLRSINEDIQEAQQSYYKEAKISAQKLTGISERLKGLELSRVETQRTISGLTDLAVERSNRLAEITQQIATLSAEDMEEKRLLTQEFENQIKLFAQQNNISQDLVDNFRAQKNIADDIAERSDRQIEIYEKQKAVLDGVRDGIVGTIETTATLYGNTVGFLGGVLTLTGFLVNKIGDVNQELGIGADFLNGMSMSAGALSFIFEDTVGTVKALSSEFGSTEAASLRTQINIGLMTSNMGISNEEAVKLTGAFARLSGGSTEIAADMIKTTQQFARQNNIIPADLMSDLANSTEAFAKFGEDGGENILKAAGYAKQLGTNMDTVTGIADKLLDFESSITAELELGALLGRDINLNKARQLAFENDLQGATKEVLNQLGGQAEFERMNVFQKQAAADLIGVQVSELQRMVQQEEKGAEQASVIRSTFDGVSESLSAIANEHLGTSLSALGGMITASAQVLGNFSLISGLNLGGMFKKMGAGLSGFAGKVGNKIGGIFGTTKELAEKTTGSKLGMARFAGGLRMLASGIASFANPATLGGLAALTASIIGLGFALRIAAPGIRAFGDAFGTIIESVGTALSTIISGIGDFTEKVAMIASPEIVAGIFGLAAGFGSLTASLAGLSVAGLAAIPALVTIGAVGSLGGLFDTEDGQTEEKTGMEKLLGEMKGLRNDLNEGKVAVYIDGKKVTSAVASVVNKTSTNSYSL